MAEVLVYGEKFSVPRVLADELVRLRALERGMGDLERERAQARWEHEFGPLPPAPGPGVEWVLVEEHRADPRPEAGGQA